MKRLIRSTFSILALVTFVACNNNNSNNPSGGANHNNHQNHNNGGTPTPTPGPSRRGSPSPAASAAPATGASLTCNYKMQKPAKVVEDLNLGSDAKSQSIDPTRLNSTSDVSIGDDSNSGYSLAITNTSSNWCMSVFPKGSSSSQAPMQACGSQKAGAIGIYGLKPNTVQENSQCNFVDATPSKAPNISSLSCSGKLTEGASSKDLTQSIDVSKLTNADKKTAGYIARVTKVGGYLSIQLVGTQQGTVYLSTIASPDSTYISAYFKGSTVALIMECSGK